LIKTKHYKLLANLVLGKTPV